VISRQQAIELFETQDLLDVAMQADAVRKRLHPEGIVTYFIDDERNALPDTVVRVTFEAKDRIEQHVGQLQTIREKQERDNAFTLLVPSFDGTAAEYLKALAISRIYLESIGHVQTSCAMGLKLCQIALRFGADDIDNPSAGEQRPSEEQLRCLIRDAGFIPKQRDAMFGMHFLR
jgi:cyclic dehypoxanthinyl futalosine synthase